MHERDALDEETTAPDTTQSEPSYLGVKRMPDGRYRAIVPVLMNGQVTHITAGTHDTAEAAARAYDRVARVHHGQRVMLNCPDEFDA